MRVVAANVGHFNFLLSTDGPAKPLDTTVGTPVEKH